MVKILQYQSTVSHPTHMRFDGEANFHAFWDKHKFYVLLLIFNYVHVAGSSTLSSSNVGLVPIMSPGYLILHSLDTAYWIPTEHTNNPPLKIIKLYGNFCGTSHEALSSCTFCDSKYHTFFVKTISRNNIDLINIKVNKKDQKHPTGPYLLL